MTHKSKYCIHVRPSPHRDEPPTESFHPEGRQSKSGEEVDGCVLNLDFCHFVFLMFLSLAGPLNHLESLAFNGETVRLCKTESLIK